MDWSKVDAALAGAMAEGSDPGRRYVVFIHLGPGGDEALTDLGLDGSGGGAVRTATVTARQVEALSSHAGVRHVALSRSLRADGN